jgi:cathepsin B
MDEIQKNGPVQVAFKVFSDFFMYKSGVYSKHPNAKLADVESPYHSVKVLGWGTENNVDYWVIIYLLFLIKFSLKLNLT